jgi:hypothetical protein
MTIQPDIMAYDSKGNLALVVEVKNKRGTDHEWATRMRRNILTHGLIPNAQYFLLALPDRFYLWKDKPRPELEKPQYEIDPLPFLKPFLERAGVQPERLSSPGFELLVMSLLNELAQTGELPDSESNGNNAWLTESGLLEAINQGHIVHEVVA